MSDKKGTNPFKSDKLNEKAREPAAEKDEAQDYSDELEADFEEDMDALEETAAESIEIGSELQKKLQAAQEQLLRAHAEAENIRRRAEQDVSRAHKYGSEKLIKAILPVVDSLEQALQNAPDDDPMGEGVNLTLTLLVDVLKKSGVTPLNPVNEKFNPQQHEAMSMQPIEGVAANTVTMVVQKGYLLSDRLVRPARVIVAK